MMPSIAIIVTIPVVAIVIFPVPVSGFEQPTATPFHR